MYPSTKTPMHGVFVRNIEHALLDSQIDISKVVIKGRHRYWFVKLVYYVSFIGRAFVRLLTTKRTVYLHYVAHSSIPYLMASVLRPIPMIAHVHGGDVLPGAHQSGWIRRLKTKLSRAALNKAYKVIVPSHFFKTLLIRELGVVEQKIEVSPSGGVNTELFTPIHKAPPSFLSQGELILGYVGRLDSGKGVETLLKSLARFKRAFHCHIVGAGSRQRELERLAITLGVRDKLTFHGAKSQVELPSFYQSFDYLVFPTEMIESLGLVGLESMACGTPVISTINGGIADYLVDGVNGFGFDSGSDESLAACLEKVCEIEEIHYKQLSSNARTTALKFDAVITNKNLLKILQ